MLKCPNCGFVLLEKETTLICEHCKYQTADPKDIQDIKDAAMIDEDMEIWRKTKKYC